MRATIPFKRAYISFYTQVLSSEFSGTAVYLSVGKSDIQLLKTNQGTCPSARLRLSIPKALTSSLRKRLRYLEFFVDLNTPLSTLQLVARTCHSWHHRVLNSPHKDITWSRLQPRRAVQP
jgi:hypothetical protein